MLSLFASLCIIFTVKISIAAFDIENVSLQRKTVSSIVDVKTYGYTRSTETGYNPSNESVSWICIYAQKIYELKCVFRI